MHMRTALLAIALSGIALSGCSDSEENLGVLPENMSEENLPAVDTVQEDRLDVDVTTVEVGNDAVAVRREGTP